MTRQPAFPLPDQRLLYARLVDDRARALRGHRTALLILGGLYVGGYYLALLVTAIASLGGGGRDYTLLETFGLLALVTAVLVAGGLLARTRRALRASPSVLGLVVGAWCAWGLVAALGPALVALISGGRGLSVIAFYAPIVAVVVATAGCVVTMQVARKASEAVPRI